MFFFSPTLMLETVCRADTFACCISNGKIKRKLTLKTIQHGTQNEIWCLKNTKNKEYIFCSSDQKGKYYAM